MVLFNTRATKTDGIDKEGDTDVETVLRFKNPTLQHLSLILHVPQQITQW